MNRPATTALIAAALILAPAAAHATPGHDPVTICHKPGTPAEHEITVDRDALDKHLKHGDAVGKCEVVTIPTEPTPEPTTDPTPEPTEEPTWEPTAPPTEEPSPEPVNPEVKPSDEPTPVQPGTPIEHGSVGSTPGSPPAQPVPTPIALDATLSQKSSEHGTPSAPETSPTTTQPTTRPELAETGFNRVLLALAAAMVAAGAAILLGSRWRRE